MPTSMMKKVESKCDYSTSEIEDKWNRSKKQAEKQGHEEDWGYITSIFKNMVSSDCKKKMGWNKNENKNIEEEYSMSDAEQILEKINMILNEKGDNDSSKIDKEKLMDALKDTAKDIFDEVDEEKLKAIADDVVKRDDIKNTEDAIQVAINMLRSEE